MPDLSPIAQHELDPDDRVAAHRLVATSMIIVFLVTAISQNWWQAVRNYVVAKTHGTSTPAKPGG